MSKESPDFESRLKHTAASHLLERLNEYLGKDTDSVSEVQIEAFRRAVNSLPEGKFKEFMGGLTKLQETSAKVNEVFYGIQDKSWAIIKPFVVMEAPLVAAVPDKPFSKLAVKSAKAGGVVSEKVVKGAVKGAENIKKRFSKKEDAKSKPEA